MSALAGELRKLPAFVRRDFLVAWSYRLPFIGDWIGLALQAFTFYFVGLMVDPSTLPSLRRRADAPTWSSSRSGSRSRRS